ncbi:MAG TPA: hypothetical protein VLR90_10785, partial [Blastocatellia bacterium]|nr:hypothetical protein [Blastocatellia bacterium]
PKNRKIILAYYNEDLHGKRDGRRRLAKRLGIVPNALRIRTHRIREDLANCLEDCLKRYNAK